MSKPAIDARPEVGGMTRESPASSFLPAPFGPKAHDLTLADFEIQVVNRRLASVAFSQVFDFDRGAVMLSDN
jgi:hypothetical protein